MKDPIVTIETAIVNRLVTHNETGDPAFKWPFKCKYIDSYGGQFGSAEEMGQAAQRAPGLWVTYEGESGELDNGIPYARLNFAVFALARSFAPAELRKGGDKTVGLYQLIEAVREALTQQTLGLALAAPLEFKEVRPLWEGGPQGKGLSLAMIRFSVRVSLDVEPHVELDDDICPTPFAVVDWQVSGTETITDKWSFKP